MSTATATTAVTTRPDINQMTIRQLLQQDSISIQVQKALPRHMKAERMLRVATTALNRVPKLMQCTQESFLRCLLELSAFGLEPDGRRAHLIPYGKECTLIIDYKGLVELVRRSGDVSAIHADVICDADEFEWNLGTIEKHKINFRKPRGDVYAAYAIVTLKDGSAQAEVMTRDEIEAIRKRSKSGSNGPWVTDWSEMAKKTVFRRLCKWLTLSPEVRDVIEADDRHSGIVETTATRIETSGNDRLAAMLAPSAPDAGPTAEDLAGTVDHKPQFADELKRLKDLMLAAETAAEVDELVGGEAVSGDWTPEQVKEIEAAGDTRKRIIAGAKVQK